MARRTLLTRALLMGLVKESLNNYVYCTGNNIEFRRRLHVASHLLAHIFHLTPTSRLATLSRTRSMAAPLLSREMEHLIVPISTRPTSPSGYGQFFCEGSQGAPIMSEMRKMSRSQKPPKWSREV